MRQVFEAFRLAYDQGRSQREIARALGLSQSTVNDYLRRFRGTGLPWPVPPEVDEAAVEARLFATDAIPSRGRPAPEWATLHGELKKKGVASSCSGSSTSSRRRTAISTRNSVSTIAPGPTHWSPHCARSTSPARKPSSTTPG